MGNFVFFAILALEFSRLSAHFSGLDRLFSRFLGSRQMAIQMIFLGSDLDSARRVSMKAPIFKPFGNPIGNVMTIFVPKPNYFIQYWRVQNLDFRLYPCDPFSGQPYQLRAFFLQTPIRPALPSNGFQMAPRCTKAGLESPQMGLK